MTAGRTLTYAHPELATGTRRPRIVVCGTRFGHLWIDSITKLSEEFELVAVIARGSAYSRAVCERYGLPWVKAAREVTGKVDAAIVAIGGEDGEKVARDWIRLGVPVLLEHPVEPAFLNRIGTSRGGLPRLEVNGHFSDLLTVRKFIEVAQKNTVPLRHFFVALVATPRTLYSCLDIVIHMLPGEEIARLVQDGAWIRRKSAAGIPMGPLHLLTTIMPLTSIVDDAAGSIGGHLIELWLPERRVILAGPTGPIITLGAGSPMSSTWTLGNVGPAVTWKDYTSNQRRAALIQALRRTLQPCSPRERLLRLQRDRLVAMVWRKLLNDSMAGSR